MSDERSPERFEYRLLVVDDEESIRVTLAEALENEQTTLVTASTGVAALECVRRERIDLVLLDQNLKESGESGIDVLRRIREVSPDTVVIMMTAYGRIDSAVEAIKLGCFQYIAKPLDLTQLRLLIKSALGTVDLRKEVQFLRREHRQEFGGEHIFGSSEKMRDALESVKKVARSGNTTVLIRGETGSGKELIARMIHESGPSARGPLITLNCSAVPDNLLESELFGHEPGAFTDARTRKPGLLEMADRGTLFLDEIGDMPLALQAKLLRVLETRTFRRLGSNNDVKVQVRFIAATNKDLFQAVEARTFRDDLYYRLSVIPIYVPPLRERRDDIGALLTYFIDRFNREIGGKIQRVSDKALEMLSNYSWPGNVRELRNYAERMVLMNHGTEVLPEDLPPEVRAASARGGRSDDDIVIRTDRVVSIEEMEKFVIEDALRKCGGNKTRAAEGLGISRQTLRSKVNDYKLDAGDGD